MPPPSSSIFSAVLPSMSMSVILFIPEPGHCFRRRSQTRYLDAVHGGHSVLLIVADWDTCPWLSGSRSSYSASSFIPRDADKTSIGSIHGSNGVRGVSTESRTSITTVSCRAL